MNSIRSNYEPLANIHSKETSRDFETVELIEFDSFQIKSPECQQRYAFLIENSFRKETFNEISYELMLKIKKRINRDDLLEKNVNLANDWLNQMNQSYKWSIKKSILDYVLKNENEQSRLNIKLNKV